MKPIVFRQPLHRSLVCAFAAALALSASQAQDEDGEVFELSPFEVDGSGDVGYAAQNTLAGSRMNSRLKDTPASISVFTKEFISDIGADSVEDTMAYSVNMTPELSQDDGDGSANQLTAFDARYRIRGLDADQARNYFAYDWDQDVYNVERVDESRGPNSILFGIGKAGGIINTSTKTPRMAGDFTTVNLTIGDADRFRAHVDFNKVLIEGKLGLRLNLLHNENGENERPWVYRRDDRYHLALKYKPTDKTTIDFEYEYGDVIDAPTQHFGPTDRATTWLASGRPLAAEGIGAAQGIAGSLNGAGYYAYVDNGAGAVINATGLPRTNSPVGLRGNNFTYENNRLADPAGAGTLIVPVDASLSGPLTMRGARDIRNLSANLRHQFGENTFVEFAWAKYEVDRFSHRMGGTVDLEGDPNATLADGSPNPYVGQLFFEASMQRDNRFFTEDYLRATASHEIKTDNWMGRHRFAVMAQTRESNFRRDSEQYVWTDPSIFGMQDEQGQFLGGPFNQTVFAGPNQVNLRHYLENPADKSDWRVGTVPGVGFGSDWDGEPLSLTVPFGALQYSGDPRFADIDPASPRTLVSSFQTNQVKDEESSIDALMFAGQSYFLDGDLVLTYGIREDDFYLFSPNGNGNVSTFNGERDEIDRANALIQEFSGQTETYGLVYHLTPRFSVAYNTSTNNGISDFSDKDIFGAPGQQGGINPVPSGESEDFSVSADLLNGALFLKATRFETSSQNISSFVSWVDGNAIGAINSLYSDLSQSGLIDQGTLESQRITAEVGTASTGAEGYEFTAVGNLTENWRAVFNYSYTNASLSDSLPEFTPWWNGATGKPFFQTFAGEALFDPTSIDPNFAAGATVGDAIAYIESAGTLVQGLAGGVAPGQQRHKASLFTNYSFREGALKNVRLGGGARYASGKLWVQANPQLGVLEFNDSVFFDAVAGWSKEFENYTLDLQLNIKNLLDEDELAINRLDDDPNPAGGFNVFRFTLPQRRDIRLTASFRF